MLCLLIHVLLIYIYIHKCVYIYIYKCVYIYIYTFIHMFYLRIYEPNPLHPGKCQTKSWFTAVFQNDGWKVDPVFSPFGYELSLRIFLLQKTTVNGGAPRKIDALLNGFSSSKGGQCLGYMYFGWGGFSTHFEY